MQWHPAVPASVFERVNPALSPSDRSVPNFLRLEPVDDCSYWYVARVRPHAEKRSIANLQNQAFRTFCPLIVKTVHPVPKVTQMQAPLFSQYFFVCLDLSYDCWRIISGTLDVERLPTRGDGPIPMPKGIIEVLFPQIGSDRVVASSRSFVCGQPVRICSGSFAEYIDNIEHLDDGKWGRVLLDCTGCSVSVKTWTDDNTPAG